MEAAHESAWLPVLAALAAWAVGIGLHLKWHPQRRHLSDAWDLLTRMPWLVLMTAALMLLAEWQTPPTATLSWSLALLVDWRALVWPLMAHAVEVYSSSLHILLPPWPLVYVAPLVLSLFFCRLVRFPYRYGTTAPPVTAKIVLALAVLGGWTWLTLEVMTALDARSSERIEAVRWMMKLLLLAATAACSQVTVVRLAINWQTPQGLDQQQDARQALHETAQRWRSVSCLAAVQLLWLLWPHDGTLWGGRWLIVEGMLVFALLPTAVALVPGTIWQQGAAAMRGLLRVFLPWCGVAVTAVAVLMLVNYATALSLEVAGRETLTGRILLPVRALVLAMVHSWLLLATVFTFLRHGLGYDAE